MVSGLACDPNKIKTPFRQQSFLAKIPCASSGGLGGMSPSQLKQISEPIVNMARVAITTNAFTPSSSSNMRPPMAPNHQSRKPFGSNSRLLNQGDYGSEIEPPNFGVVQAMFRPPNVPQHTASQGPSTQHMVSPQRLNPAQQRQAIINTMTPVLKMSPFQKQYFE